MATVEYGLAEGLRYVEDSRTGQISYTVNAYCKDLNPVGGGSPFGTAAAAAVNGPPAPAAPRTIGYRGSVGAGW